MNQLIVVLMLVLASSNASKYIQPFQQLQQQLLRQTQDYPFNFNGGYDDNYFGSSNTNINSGTSQLEGWASPTDPHLFNFIDFQTSGQFNPDELRRKRPDASLSIVNALDVLRQRIMMDFARRKINESRSQMQKNHELLLKTGKRSHRNLDESSSYGIQEFLLRKRMLSDDLRNALQNIMSRSDEESPSDSRHQNEAISQT